MRNTSIIALATLSAAVIAAASPARAATGTIVVESTIQAAVDSAAPGDTVVVPAGTYRENILVTTPGLTIEGRPGAVLDGAGLAGSAGIRVRATVTGQRLAGFTVAGLHVTNYSFTGILLSGVDGFRVTGGTYTNNEEYGIFPIRSTGRVDFNTVRGSNDSGIYVGQSDGIRIDHNVVSDNTVGIEVELATEVTVEHNRATGNSVGVLVQVVPFLSRTETRNVTVRANVLSGNTRPNPVTDPDELLSRLPSGVGLLDVAGDRLTVTDNVIAGNPAAGVGVVSLPADIAALDPRLDPAPDLVMVADNTVLGNGTHSDPRLGGLSPADLVWDGTGTGICFTVRAGQRTYPTDVPSC